jgi:uncharacterized protein with PQ loop repeat
VGRIQIYIHMIEFIGYLATLLVMFSFLMKEVNQLRIVNAIGCSAWILYGVLIESNPVIITNVGILLINSVHLTQTWLKKYRQ